MPGYVEPRSITKPLLWLCLASALASTACGASVGSRQSFEEGTDPVTGEPSSSYSTDARVYADADEKRLEDARTLARNRRYPEAIEIFRDLSADPAVKTKYREGALFSLGEAQGAVFNPNKDYEAAILTLERFVKLYPDSERRDEAESLISGYRQILQQY